jgi:dipeptidase D
VTFVSDLKPSSIWKHFDRILTIPRGSKNEDEICSYLMRFAQGNGLESLQDGAGNVVIRKPASSGLSASPCTILQCHVDMVNEKNSEVLHDFDKDPIQPVTDGDYLTAQGTTLGADNGIGIAAAMAVLENQSLVHGPIECLFTVDEETGLTGASALSPEILSGHYLINLDSEEEGVFCIGCAGGSGQDITLGMTLEPCPPNCQSFEVELKGLKGGHSGVDIHLQRGNAIQLLARALDTVLPTYNLQLAYLKGGNMHNAIPRESLALLEVPSEVKEQFKSDLNTTLENIRSEFSSAEPDMVFSISEASCAEAVLDADSTTRLIRLLHGLIHGVVAMSYDIDGLVETSANLATVRVDKDQVKIHVSTRSSTDSALDAIQLKTEAVCSLAGASTNSLEGYPGWQPDVSSELLKVAKQVHADVLGFEPEVLAIHAGLECGIIKQKYPDLEMLSVGPQIEFPHSPDERVKISSVDDFFKFLTKLLERIAEKSG